MKGLVLAEQAHVVNILAPVDITGGKTSQAVNMANYQHVSFLVQIGVSAAAFTKILVEQCTDNANAGATAIPFAIYVQETAGASNDVLGARTALAAAGYTPSAADGIFYVVEIDASELDGTNNGAGGKYLQLHLTNGSNSVIASAVAILSGGRYVETQSPTVTA
jgi:hypothetical protein